MGSMTGIQFLEGARILFLHHHVQTSPGAHPTSYTIGTKGYYPSSEVARV